MQLSPLSARSEENLTRERIELCVSDTSDIKSWLVVKNKLNLKWGDDKSELVIVLNKNAQNKTQHQNVQTDSSTTSASTDVRNLGIYLDLHPGDLHCPRGIINIKMVCQSKYKNTNVLPSKEPKLQHKKTLF